MKMIDEAINMIEAKKRCLEREASGTDHCCNNNECDECALCYEQGTIAELEKELKAGEDICIQATSSHITFEFFSQELLEKGYVMEEVKEESFCGKLCSVSVYMVNKATGDRQILAENLHLEPLAAPIRPHN